MDEITAIAKQLRQKETWLRAILDSAAELSSLSRALKSPSNPARRLTDLLWQNNLQSNGADPQQAQADVFKHAVIDFVNLENELLDLASIEAGDFRLDVIDFDLKSVVDQTMARVRLSLQARDLILRTVLLPGLPRHFSGDPGRLQQIVGNLLENATRRMQSGEIVLRIQPDPEDPHHLRMEVTSLSTVNHCQCANFLIADTESKKPAAIADLRLDFCRQLIQQMGGELVFGTSAPSGRLFTLDFCFAPASAQFLGSSPDVPASINASAAGALRVLIAEDSEDSRFLLQEFLKGENFELTFAEHGKAAFEASQTQSFDLILMDIQMPVMDGLTATRLIRRDEKENGRPSTPLLALTANARKSDIELSMAAGCDAHILKPISKVGLLQTIQKYTSAEKPPVPAPIKAAKVVSSQEDGVLKQLMHGQELQPVLMTNM